MSNSERLVQNKIRLALSGLATIFKVNSGRGWTGNNISRLSDGSLVIKDPRPFASGLPTGTPDLIGFKEIIISPDMVGKTIAQFCAIEVKAGKNKTTTEQDNFLNVVQRAGGITGVARSAEDAIRIITKGEENEL